MNKELQANYTEANLENLFDFADENLVTISEALLESFNILAEKHLNEYINKRVNISKHLLVMDQNQSIDVTLEKIKFDTDKYMENVIKRKNSDLTSKLLSNKDIRKIQSTTHQLVSTYMDKKIDYSNIMSKDHINDRF